MSSESEMPADKEETGLLNESEASPDPETATDRAATQSPSRIERHRSRPNHLRALSSPSHAEFSDDTIPDSPSQEAGESTPSPGTLSGSSSPPRLRRSGLNRHRTRPRQLSAAGLLDPPQPSPLSRAAGTEEEEVNIPTLSRANTAPTSQADFACISASTISHPEDLIHIPTLSLEEAQFLPDINTINRINAEIAWDVPRPSPLPSPIPASLLPGSRASTWPTQDPNQRQEIGEAQDPRQSRAVQDYHSCSHVTRDSGHLGYCACRPIMLRHANTVEEGRCVICKLPVPPPPPYR
ncbi:hypothetical protein BDV97DRAFT_369798 [Delphinella strobiligena]|nr:hypothetical protein BDV97DRAFT_369798 [Delphinella strobiligena]